jgi:hypothetical protein
MGILEQSQYDYYNNPSAFGNYQFTSLDNIIRQFLVVYTGEEKIISKVSTRDVRFYAQRSLAELSFDTLKSIKSQEIVLPPSLTMILPHDYVNYTRVLSVDSAGIKHPLYPTSDTQNPFKILQKEDKSYEFITPATSLFSNGDFSNSIPNPNAVGEDWNLTSAFTGGTSTDQVHIVNEQLVFEHGSNAPIFPQTGATTSRAYSCYQKIDVSNIDLIDLSALGKSAAAATGKGVGTLRVGISTLTYPNYNPNAANPNSSTGFNNTDEIFDLYTTSGARALLTFNNGLNTESTLSITDVDVSNQTEVYVLITSFIEDFTDSSVANSQNVVDNIVLTVEAISPNLIEGGESTTWNSYKSSKPSENQQHDYDYDDNIFEANVGRRYGLDPAHAQDNGSYYIDNLRGKIHFSSNLAGKTVVLDYISDSLGTDDEMQVHKFAEEAMYKSIIYYILSTRINTPEYIIRRYKREKFAAIRQAKLRLSNLKLEELVQTLRGKSKQIKH